MPRTAELKRPMSDAVTATPAAPKHESTDATMSDAAASPARISELRVSAHLMMLETGLYCVFPTPGSPDPDPVTGLPGVRVTPAPSISGRPEAVSVSTFREDGWLNGTAALVRVTDGHAQILVSVYQDVGQKRDAAPRLQVLRLSKELDGAASEHEGAGSPATERSSTPAEPNPEIMAHVQRTGDVAGKVGEWIGVRGSRQWLEGFGLAPNVGISPEDIEYQGVLGRNWLSPWIEGGKYCGSRGMALPLLGLKLRLKGAAAKIFECTCSATFVDGSAVGPVGAGEACEAESLAPLEAFQVIIRRRGAKQEVTKKAPDKKLATAPKPKGPARSIAKPIVRPTGRR
jgi:hypothetical protein